MEDVMLALGRFDLQFQQLLVSYGIMVIWIAVFLFGENAIIAAFAFASYGIVPLQVAIVYCFLGSLSADIFWYFTSKRLLHRFYAEKFEKESKRFYLLRLANSHTFAVLTIIKFLMGMRLFLTVYIVLYKRIPFLKYLFFNVVGTCLFLATLFPIGWFLSRAVSTAFSVAQSITLVISIVLLINIFAKLIPFLLRTYARRSNKMDPIEG